MSGSAAAPTAERLFDSILESELGKPRVSAGTGFGTNKGLRTSGKIYAIFGRGQLVVKLPEARVTSLMRSGLGSPFGAGKRGRVMKEWVTVPASASRQWQALVEEARQFVGGARLPASGKPGPRVKPVTRA